MFFIQMIGKYFFICFIGWYKKTPEDLLSTQAGLFVLFTDQDKKSYLS